ncbi:MAG: class I SAM-dependent methyltransferase, partial [Burkholderiaceae bacterium]
MQALYDAIAQADIAPNNRAARRLFHGRGGLYPGCEHLALDWYPPAWLLTSFSPLAPDTLKALDEAIVARSAALGLSTTVCWVYQCRDQGRAETVVMRGNLPAPHVVTEGSSAFVVNVAKGQNHGLFLDMANGRQWLRENMMAKPGARVLNLFAYTCAFSVVAKQAGAAEVVNLDMSDGALRIGQQNHQLNA